MPLLTPNVPAGLIDLMKELAKEVLRDKPENIFEFAVIHFEKLIQQRDGSLNKGYHQFVAFDKHFDGQQLFAVPPNCGYTCQRPIHIQPILHPKKSKSDMMAGFKAMESINEEDVILPENPYADKKYQNAIYVIQRFYRRYAAKKKNQTNPTLTATTAAIIIQRTMRRLFAKKIHPKPTTDDNAKQDGIAQDDVDNVSEAASYTSSSTIQMLADGQEGRENRLSGHEHELVHSDIAVVVVEGADDGSTEFKEPTTVAQDEVLVPEKNSEVGAGPVEMDKKSMAHENVPKKSIHQEDTKHDHPTLDAPDDDTSTAPIGKLSTKIGSNDQQNSHHTNAVEIDSNSSDLTQIPTSVEEAGNYSLNSTQTVGSTPDRIPEVISLRLLGSADTDNNTANPFQARKINVDAGESSRTYDVFYQDKDDPDFSDSLNESTMERDSLENEDLDVDSLELNEHVTHVSLIPKREVKEDDRILYGDGDTDEVNKEDKQDVQKTVELERVPTYLYGIHPSRTPLVEKKYKRNRSSPSAENRKVCDTNESPCVVYTSMTAEEEDESLESKESTSEESSATQIENLRVHKYDKLTPEEVNSMADEGESIKMHEEEVSSSQKDQEIHFEEKLLADKQNLKSTDLKSSPEEAALTETKFDTLSERTNQKAERNDFSEYETPRVLKITSSEGLREPEETITETCLSKPNKLEGNGTEVPGHVHIGDSQLQVATVIAHSINTSNEDLHSDKVLDNSPKSGASNLISDRDSKSDPSPFSNLLLQKSDDAVTSKKKDDVVLVKEESKDDFSPIFRNKIELAIPKITIQAVLENDIIQDDEEPKKDLSYNEIESSNDEKQQTIHRGKRSINVIVDPPIFENDNTEIVNKSDNLEQCTGELVQNMEDSLQKTTVTIRDQINNENNDETTKEMVSTETQSNIKMQADDSRQQTPLDYFEALYGVPKLTATGDHDHEVESQLRQLQSLSDLYPGLEIKDAMSEYHTKEIRPEERDDKTNLDYDDNNNADMLEMRLTGLGNRTLSEDRDSAKSLGESIAPAIGMTKITDRDEGQGNEIMDSEVLKDTKGYRAEIYTEDSNTDERDIKQRERVEKIVKSGTQLIAASQNLIGQQLSEQINVTENSKSSNISNENKLIWDTKSNNECQIMPIDLNENVSNNENQNTKQIIDKVKSTSVIENTSSKILDESKYIEKAPSVHAEHCFGNPIDSETQSKVHPIVEILKLNDGTAQNVSVKLSKVDEEAHDFDKVEESLHKPTALKGKQENYSIDGSNMTDDQANTIEGETTNSKHKGNDTNQASAKDKMLNLKSDIKRINGECHTIDDNCNVNTTVKSESSKEIKPERTFEDESETKIVAVTPEVESEFALKKVGSLIHIEGNMPQPENTASEKSNLTDDLNFSSTSIKEGEPLTKSGSTIGIGGNLHLTENTTFEMSNLTDGQKYMTGAEILNPRLRESLNIAGSTEEQSEALGKKHDQLFNLTAAQTSEIRTYEKNVEPIKTISEICKETSEPTHTCKDTMNSESQNPEEKTAGADVECKDDITVKCERLKPMNTEIILDTETKLTSRSMSTPPNIEGTLLEKIDSTTDIDGNLHQSENTIFEKPNLAEDQANEKEEKTSILKPIKKFNEKMNAESEVATLDNSEETRMTDLLEYAKKSFYERELDHNHDLTETFYKNNDEANNNITTKYEGLDDSTTKSTLEGKNYIISDKVSSPLVQVNQETVRKDDKINEIQENTGRSENFAKPNSSKSIIETTIKDEMENQKAENMISKHEPTLKVIHDSTKMGTPPLTKEGRKEFSSNFKNINDESDVSLKAAEDTAQLLEDGLKNENEQQMALETELLDENNQPALNSASSDDSSINKLKATQKSNVIKSEDNLKSDQITENWKLDIKISAKEENLKSDQEMGKSADMIMSEKNFIDKNTSNKTKKSVDSSDIRAVQNDEDQLNDKLNLEVKDLDDKEIKEDPCLQDHGQFELKETIEPHNDQEILGVVSMDIKSCSDPGAIVVGRSGIAKVSEDKPEFDLEILQKHGKNILINNKVKDESNKVQKTPKDDVSIKNDPASSNNEKIIQGEAKQINSLGSSASASCEDSNADTSADFSSIGPDLDFFEDTISYLRTATKQLSTMDHIFSEDIEKKQPDKQHSHVDKETELTLTAQTGQQMEASDENELKDKRVEGSKRMPKSVDLLDQAAVVIQSAVRGYQARKDIGKMMKRSETLEVSERKLSSGEIKTDQSLIAHSDDRFQKMNSPIALIHQNVEVTRSENPPKDVDISNDKKLDHKIEVEIVSKSSTSAEEKIEISSNIPQRPPITREKPIEKNEKPAKDQNQLVNPKENPIKRETKPKRVFSREKPVERKPRTFKSDSLDETKSQAVKYDTLDNNSKPSISQPSSGRTKNYNKYENKKRSTEQVDNNFKMTDQKTKNHAEKTDAKSNVSSTSNDKQNQYGRKGKSLSVYDQKSKSTTFDLKAIKKDLLTTRKVKTPPQSGIKTKTVAITYPRKKGEDAVGLDNQKSSKIADSSNKSMNAPVSSIMLEQNNLSDHFEGIRDEKRSTENKNGDSKTELTNKALDVDQHLNSKNADHFEEISDEKTDLNHNSKLIDISLVNKNDEAKTELPYETIYKDPPFDDTEHADNFEGTSIENTDLNQDLKLHHVSAENKNDGLELDQHSDSLGTIVDITDSSRDWKSSDISSENQNDDSNKASEKEHLSRDFGSNYNLDANLNEKLVVVAKKILAINSDNDKCEDDNVDSKLVDNLSKDIDPMQQMAATKIQKTFKGYKTRKNLNKSKMTKHISDTIQNDCVANPKPNKAQHETSDQQHIIKEITKEPQEKTESLDIFNNLKREVDEYRNTAFDKSAITIQKNFRGYKTRKDMKTDLKKPDEEVLNKTFTVDSAAKAIEKLSEESENHRTNAQATEEESNSAHCKAKLDKSATTIQSNFRGYKTRKDMQNHALGILDHTSSLDQVNSGNETAVEADKCLPTTDLSQNKMVEKVHEGKLEEKSVTSESLGIVDSLKREVEDLKNNFLEKSATVIQKTYRGYKTRKAVQDDAVNRSDNAKTMTPEILVKHEVVLEKQNEAFDGTIDISAKAIQNETNDLIKDDNDISALDTTLTFVVTEPEKHQVIETNKSRESHNGDIPIDSHSLTKLNSNQDLETADYVDNFNNLMHEAKILEDSSLEKSATVIQKTYRGYKARNNLKEDFAKAKNLEISKETPSKQAPKYTEDHGDRLDKSATEIQKSFIGYKTRKDIKDNLAASKEIDTTSTQILPSETDNDDGFLDDADKSLESSAQNDLLKAKSEGETSSSDIDEQAALTIQKMYRGFKTRFDLFIESQINQPEESELATKDSQNEADSFGEVRSDASSNTSSTVDNEKPREIAHTEGSDLATKTVRATSACALLEDAASTIQKAYRDYTSRKENPIKSYSHGAQRENAVKETTTENSDESSTFIGPDTSFDLSDVDSVETKSTPTLVALDDEKFDDIELEISNSPSFAFTIPSEELELATPPKDTSHLSVSPHGIIRKRSITDPTAPALDDILNAYESHKPQWYVGDDLIIPSDIASEPSSTHSLLASSSSVEKLNSLDTRNEILNSNLQLTPSINSAVVSTSSLLFDPKETEMHANHNLKHLNNNSRLVSADKEDISKVKKEESITAEEKSEKERLEEDIFEDNGTIPQGLTNMGETLTITCTDPFSPRNVSEDAKEDSQVVVAELCKNCADGVHEVHEYDVEVKSSDMTTNEVELDDKTLDQATGDTKDVDGTTDKHFDEIKQFVLMEDIDSAVEHKESQKVIETSGNKNIDDNETSTLEKIHGQQNSTSIDNQMSNIADDGDGTDEGEKSTVAVKVVDQDSKEICIVEVADGCRPSIAFIPASSEDDISDRESIQEQQIICETTSGVNTSIHDNAKVFEVGDESCSNKHEKSPLKVLEKLESNDTCQEDVKGLLKKETNKVVSVKQLEEIGSNNLDDEHEKQKHDDNVEFKKKGAIASTSVENNCNIEMVNESILERDTRTSNEITNVKLASTENGCAAETVKIDKQNENNSNLEISEVANLEKYTTEENKLENDLNTEGLTSKDHAVDNADISQDGDFQLRANVGSFNKNEIIQHENAENVSEIFINPSEASSHPLVKCKEIIQENSEMNKDTSLDELSRSIKFDEITKSVTGAQEQLKENNNSLEDKKTLIDQPDEIGGSLKDLQPQKSGQEERPFEQTSIEDTPPIIEIINDQKSNLNKSDTALNCEEGNSESNGNNVKDTVNEKAVVTLKDDQTNVSPKKELEDLYEKVSLEDIKEESSMPESIDEKKDDFEIATKLLQHSDSITEADLNAMLKSVPEIKKSKQYSEVIKIPTIENIDPVDIVDNVKQEQEKADRSVSDDPDASTKSEIEAKLDKLIEDAQPLNEKDESSVDRQDLPTEDSLNEVIEQPCVKKIVPPTPLSATSDQDESELESTTTKADSTTTTLGYDGTSDNDAMEIPHSMPDGLEAVAEKLRETEATIARMQQRRASEHKISIDQLSAFDEPMCEPIRSMRELQKSSSTEVEDDIILQKIQREDTTRESSAQSESVIFGDSQLTESEDIFNDRKIIHHIDTNGVDGSTYKSTNPLFKSVTIDDTVKYIDPEKSTEESGGSFCLDDAITADVRKKMMAYSISEADSDYYDAGERTVRLHDDFNISTALDHLPSSDTDTTIISAATKIQAGARGFLTRRRLRRASMGAKTSLTEETKTSFGNDAIGESLEQLVEEEDAKRKSKVQYHRQVGVNSLPSALGNSTETEIVHLSSHEVIHVTDDSGELKLPANLTTVMEEKITLPHGESSSAGDQSRKEGNQNLIKSPSESDVNAEQETDDESAEVPPNLEATLAARRLTLQRGDAMRNDSTPDDDNGNAKQVDAVKALSSVITTNTLIHQSTLVESITTTTVVATTTATATADRKNYSDAAMAMKLDKVKWFAMRQNSMPVQIDSEVFRVLPKHMRKRIKSAEGEKKKRIRLPRD